MSIHPVHYQKSVSQKLLNVLLSRAVAENKTTDHAIKQIQDVVKSFTYTSDEIDFSGVDRITDYFVSTKDEHTVHDILCTLKAAKSKFLLEKSEYSMLVVERALTTTTNPQAMVKLISETVMKYNGDIVPTYSGWLDIIDIERDNGGLNDNSPHLLYAMVDNANRPTQILKTIKRFRKDAQNMDNPLYIAGDDVRKHDDFGNPYSDFDMDDESFF